MPPRFTAPGAPCLASETWVRRIFASASALVACLLTTLPASSQQPLPANYKPILDNPTVLVQRVHYGPHEFVPMHDHYPVVTVLVYLNDSGVVEIAHEPKPGDTEPDILKRPPTHTGAWRIGPAAFERHSIRNLGDVPSDFLRVELKQIPPDWIKDQVRSPAPNLTPGVHTEYADARLRIERIICAEGSPCVVPASDSPSVVITLPTVTEPTPEAQLVQWVRPHVRVAVAGREVQRQLLRILLPQP